ncbi:MAG: flagellar hook assembly protein FlgD [Candidatus Neomarinimicrobiota bacterium]
MVDATQATGGSLVFTEGIQSNNSVTITHDEFLTLLIAELENQDPLAPMQSQEMAAQLAQFGSLERLYSIDRQIGESLNVDLLMTQAVNNTMAANLIGRELVAVGDSILLKDGGATLHFKLEDPAAEVTITILDESGQAVRTIRREDLLDGEQEVVWNGADDAGRLLSEGVYRFNITARDADGNPVNAVTTASGIITGISYETGMAVLLVGDLEFPMGNVISIRIPED